MAWSVGCFMKVHLGVLSNKVIRHTIQNQVRTLYSKEGLGLVGFEYNKELYKGQYLNLEDGFRTKMQSYVKDEGNNIIFTEDLKVMLHIAKKTPEDIQLLVQMLKKFNSQSATMRFGSFVFGPVVMRALHSLNEPEVAIEIYSDPKMFKFFDQVSAYHVFLDLLYRNKKYSEIRRIYDIIKQRIPDGKVHPRNALILATAACYKENTPEAFKWAMDIWRQLCERGYPQVRRVYTHLVALALRQGQPQQALEILGNVKHSHYIAIRCLKIMTYVDLDRLDDVVPHFRNALENDIPHQQKQMFFKDAIEKVEEAIERKNLGPEEDIVKLLKIIRNLGYVQEMTLDDHIDTPVSVVTPNNMKDASYNRHTRQNEKSTGPRYFRDPGLRDLI